MPFQAAIRGVLPFGETVTVPGLVLAFMLGAWLSVGRRRIPVSLTLVAATMGVTLPLAAMSWHFVEKPALALKGPLAAWRPRLRYGLRRITRS